MSESEHTEYMNLINLWNCTEPMTPAQVARMAELDTLAGGFEECVSELPKGADSPRQDATDNRLALALPPLTTKNHEKETNTNEAKTRRQEESWWQLSSSDLFADSRAEALAG